MIDYSQSLTSYLSCPWDSLRGSAMRDAKEITLIAAVGGHNILFYGPPGGGKSTLARCLPSLLPPLSEEEQQEIIDCTESYDHSGIVRRPYPPEYLMQNPPFRCVSPTTTPASLLGGGRLSPSPGEIALANHGILYLDEILEYPRKLLDTLRNPIADGEITILRSGYSQTFATDFLLACSCNPCPCGYSLYPSVRSCICSPRTVTQYRSHLSGPFTDRIDIYCEVAPAGSLLRSSRGDVGYIPIDQAFGLVLDSRMRQTERQGCLNHELASDFCFGMDGDNIPALSHDALHAIENGCGHLSTRKQLQLIRVSRSVADFCRSEWVHAEHVETAAQLIRRPW